MHTTIVFLFCIWFLSKLWIGGSYDLPKYNKIFYKLEVNFTIEKYIVCIEPKIICSPDIVIPLNIYMSQDTSSECIRILCVVFIFIISYVSPVLRVEHGIMKQDWGFSQAEDKYRFADQIKRFSFRLLFGLSIFIIFACHMGSIDRIIRISWNIFLVHLWEEDLIDKLGVISVIIAESSWFPYFL